MKFTRWLIGFLSLCFVMQAVSQTVSSQENVKTMIINTKLGQVKGIVAGNIAQFRSVPYAQNPFDKRRRFQAPQAMQPWHGVLDATEYQPPVPQPSRGKEITLQGAPGDLTLNILTPVKQGRLSQKLPVLVWIPGGAFIRENASEAIYSGAHFARDGVIVVTVNYRVGVDGFMHIPGAPDNRGILDQIAALQWVQDHIASFGGDPEQVTLAGQSAGAECVTILLGIPQTQGLFRSAIIQSPPVQTVTLAEAERVTLAMGQLLGIRPTAEQLARTSYLKLAKAVVQMGSAVKDRAKWGMMSWRGTAFVPVIDQQLLVGSPIDNLTRFAKPSVSVLIGSTDQEFRLYLVPNGRIDQITMSQVSQLLGDLKLPAHMHWLCIRNTIRAWGISTRRWFRITPFVCRPCILRSS
jgi:para-nitrobenzyl esterase